MTHRIVMTVYMAGVEGVDVSRQQKHEWPSCAGITTLLKTWAVTNTGTSRPSRCCGGRQSPPAAASIQVTDSQVFTLARPFAMCMPICIICPCANASLADCINRKASDFKAALVRPYTPIKLEGPTHLPGISYISFIRCRETACACSLGPGPPSQVELY